MAPNKPVRIAQLVGNAVSGGVSACVFNYYLHVDRQRVQFDFFTYGPSDYDEKIRALGGNVYYTPNFIKFPSAMRAFGKVLSENDYDIVHSHLTSLSVFPLYVAKKHGVPVRISHAHSTTHPHEKTAIVKNTLKHFATTYATDLFACGEKSARWLYGDKKYPEVFLMNNAVDLDKFAFDPVERDAIRSELNISGLCVGNIGRAVYQKNQSFLIKAFAELLKLRPDSTLVIIADGALKDDLKKEAASLSLGDRFILLDERKDAYRYYNAFDCFALPSRYEGLPIVGIEAQANGIPCFFSDTITPAAAVGGKCEFLPVSDPALWAREINAKADLCRYDARDALIDNGYDINFAAELLMRKYEEILKRTK